MRKASIWSLWLAVFFGLFFFLGWKDYQRSKAIENNIAAMSYNTKSYKCATIREYDDGRVIVHYNRHKKGC